MPFYIDPRVGSWTIGLFVEKCWLIRAVCSGCGREGRLQATELRQLPQEATAGSVVSRLKCEACGGSGGYADFLQDRTAAMARDRAEYLGRMGGEAVGLGGEDAAEAIEPPTVTASLPQRLRQEINPSGRANPVLSAT